MNALSSGKNQIQGHRERLRSRFRDAPGALSQIEELELLLSYAIPRIDLKPLSQELLDRFGSIHQLILADVGDLRSIQGVGDQVVTYLKVLEKIVMQKTPENQPLLIPDLPEKTSRPKASREKKVFTDDETENSVIFLPLVSGFSSLDAFKQHLINNLPYNALSTRKRRAGYILTRFFPQQSLEVPLTYFLGHSKSRDALPAIVFYSILKSEPLPRRIAQELIYPNLPLGFIRRSQLMDFIAASEPEFLPASIEKSVIAIMNLYKDSGTAVGKGDRLLFHFRTDDIEAFLYILLSEFPQPGMYAFEEVFQGPCHRWLLWDKEWIKKQLYNLRDMGVISKISEIDTINQFSLGMNQWEALQFFYSSPDARLKAIREQKMK